MLLLNKHNYLQNAKHTKFIYILLCFVLFFAPACNTGEETKGEVTEAVLTYTCPMHPQVVQHKPGLCPVCNMDLVPFDKNNQDPFLTLSKSQQQLANITTLMVGDGDGRSTIRLNGKLVINPTQTKLITSRIAGRVEQLWFKETGVAVRKGQPVYRIYSEMLSGLQQEYLLNKAQAVSFPDNETFKQLEQSARQKLLLYGLTQNQINNLSLNDKTYTQVFYAPQDGVITEIMVNEGGYVDEGGIIMQLEGYDNIWVEANVYPSEASALKEGDKVQVSVSGSEANLQTMTIDFISPALVQGKQLQTIRGSLKNTAGWQTGQQVVVHLPKKQTDNDAIVVPIDAVIRDVHGAHVWIAGDSSRFEPRIVTTATETAQSIVITKGLLKGETIVATGAYLLYSEFILKRGINPSQHLSKNHIYHD